MSRRRAWILAAIVSASLMALIIGVGATIGEFGFGGGQRGAEAEGPQPTATAPAGQPLRENFIADTQQQGGDLEGDESHDDDKQEHERDGRDEEHDGTKNDAEVDD